MFKKLVSAFIIFSLLFPDVARCGNFLGGGAPDPSEDEGESRFITVKRTSIQNNIEPGDGTPLLSSELRDTDPIFIPPLVSDFLTTAQRQDLSLKDFGAHGVSLTTTDGGVDEETLQTTQSQDLSSDTIVPHALLEALSPMERTPLQIPVASAVDLSDSEDDPEMQIVFKGLKTGGDAGAPLINILSNVDSEGGNKTQGNLPVIKDENVPSKVGGPKGKEELVSLDENTPDGETLQKMPGELSAAERHRINVYNQQSWKPLTELQKQALKDEDPTKKLTFFGGLGAEPINSKQVALNIQTPDEDTNDLCMSPNDGFPILSSQTEEFLRYVKVRVVDGKLNWKQILGIGGGIIIGAGVAWPWMYVMFNALLEFYGNAVMNSIDADDNVDPDVLNAYFLNFSKYINFTTMVIFVGMPTGIATASKATSILTDFAKDNIQSFSIHRSTKHVLALISAKTSPYIGAVFVGLLPIYFLYKSILIDCVLGGYYQNATGSDRGFYGVSTDIFLNISTDLILDDNPDNINCTQVNTLQQTLEKIYLFEIGAPFLFLSTFLRYGHQLSQSAENWIDNYFFAQIRDSISFPSIVNVRHKYISQFKELKRMINEASKAELESLYHKIFKDKIKKTDLNFKDQPEQLTHSKALTIFKHFKKFHDQHENNLQDEESANWKKTWAARLGWAIPLMATMGKIVIFQYAFTQLLDAFSDTDYFHGAANIASWVLSASLANLTQGWAEKEAVEQSVYEILGGKKLAQGQSHNTVRVGLKIWGYLYGIFHTLPYLVVGLISPDRFSTDLEDLSGTDIQALVGDGNTDVNIRQILFLLSFGIADAFNNAATFHRSNGNLVNAFDSVKSYWASTLEYKQDKLTRIVHQLRKLFKKLDENILQEMDHLLHSDQGEKSLDGPLLETFHQILQIDTRTEDEERDFIIAFPLSSEAQEFLHYFKKRVINETLNWKQKLGVGGGILTGIAITWPIMLIIYDGLLAPYILYVFDNYDITQDAEAKMAMEEIENLSSYINFETLMAIIGVPMLIDAASRTSSILMDFTADQIGSFSLKKTQKHEWALLAAKSTIYIGVAFTGILPLYYLYASIVGCNNNVHVVGQNDTCFTLTVSYDIFFNLSTEMQLSEDSAECFTSHCSAIRSDLPLENILLFGIGAPFLFFDIFLQYGHQLVHHAKYWINDYFFTQMRKFSQFSLAESIRQKYLIHFKNIKQSIDTLNEDVLDNLYNDIVVNDGKKIDKNFKGEAENSPIHETIRILKVLKNIPCQHDNHSEEEISAEWNKTWSFRIGCAIPLIATFGRMIIFQYLIEEVFKVFEFEGMGSTFLSVMLGGLFANLAQGWIEKDGTQKAIYEILGGKKISHERSHTPLRVGIKVWDYIYGAFHTLPYLAIGRLASSNPFSSNRSYLSPWQYLLLISFGLADMFNNAIGFHESNLKVVNAYDSLRSYWSPTPEYKRDKLVRIMSQSRKLFKELDHDVLLELDQVLNGTLENRTQDEENKIILKEEDSI
jgi:hypothetical protein